MHSHSYAGKTSYNDAHWHNYQGITSNDPDVPDHIHNMAGNTSLDDGHVHGYCSPTGPAIYVDGKHYHMYCGVTEIADQHVHTYEAATSPYYGEYYEKCPPCQ